MLKKIALAITEFGLESENIHPCIFLEITSVQGLNPYYRSSVLPYIHRLHVLYTERVCFPRSGIDFIRVNIELALPGESR